MVKYGNEVFAAIEEGGKVVSAEEKKMQTIARRSIVAASDIEKDRILTLKDLGFKRPGDGISPAEYQYFIGKKLINPKKMDEKIDWHDVQ